MIKVFHIFLTSVCFLLIHYSFSPLFSDNVKNVWSYTSTPTIRPHGMLS